MYPFDLNRETGWHGNRIFAWIYLGWISVSFLTSPFPKNEKRKYIYSAEGVKKKKLYIEEYKKGKNKS